MVLYEVNLEVDAEIADEFAQWLEAHIQEMLGFAGFESVTWYQRVPNDDANDDANNARQQWIVHYHVHSQADLDNYFANHAERMRADGQERFAGRFAANRRVLNERKSLHK